MKLSIKHKASLIGWTLGLLNLIILFLAYNLFIAPHFGLKSISFNAFIWTSIIYIIQKSTGKKQADRTDEEFDELIRLGKENAFGKVLAISLMLYLWYSSI
jgi:hypothetical protein